MTGLVYLYQVLFHFLSYSKGVDAASDLGLTVRLCPIQFLGKGLKRPAIVSSYIIHLPTLFPLPPAPSSPPPPRTDPLPQPYKPDMTFLKMFILYLYFPA